MPNALRIDATNYGFFQYGNGAGTTASPADFWGQQTTYLGGRFHLHASDSRWMSESSHGDPLFDIVATLSPNGFSAGPSADEGVVHVIGTTVFRNEGGVMVPVATVTMDEIAVQAYYDYLGGVYVDEGATGSWIATIGISMYEYASAYGLEFYGSSANDIFDLGVWTDLVAGIHVELGAGDDSASLSEFDDFATAGRGNDTISSLGGSDTIYAGPGNDIITHGDSDTAEGALIFGQAGNDEIGSYSNRGTASDTIYAGLGDDIVWNYGGDDISYGGGGADTIIDEAGADTIFGENGNDTLRGGGGNDSISGGADNDSIEGNRGDDKVFGNRGNDLCLGDFGNDLISGGAGHDTLSGGNGNDTLKGGSGNDSLEGGKDTDLLSGGLGLDHFIFNSILEIGNTLKDRDRITDFTQGEDTIDLNAIDANSTAYGNQNFLFVGKSAFTGVAGELRYHHTPSGKTIIRGDVDGDATSDFQIELDGIVSLSSTDFVL